MNDQTTQVESNPHLVPKVSPIAGKQSSTLSTPLKLGSQGTGVFEGGAAVEAEGAGDPKDEAAPRRCL